MDDKRRCSRVKAVLPVRISGNDNSGNSYSGLVHTLDITEAGAKLGALRQPLKIGSQIILQYKQYRAAFRVVWTEPVPGRTEHQAGLEAVHHRDIWGLAAELKVQVPLQPLQPATASAGV